MSEIRRLKCPDFRHSLYSLWSTLECKSRCKCFSFQVVKDVGLDATDEKLKEYVWSLLKSGQVIHLVKDGQVGLGLVNPVNV